MSFTVHHAADPELLVAQLARLLATPMEDPFAREVVLVPARGVERWITQRLSHTLGASVGDDGVCAGVEFASPHSLVAKLLRCDDEDPWHRDQLVWTVLEVIDAHLDDDWCAPLARHLGHLGAHDADTATRRGDRRYAVARRIAGLFASYAAQRPAVLAAWRTGHDTDGCGQGLDDDLTWQPHLWRHVLERVPAQPPDLRHHHVVQRLRDGDPSSLAGLALPGRLSVFGHTRMPRTDHEALVALGGLREVHLWLPQASPELFRTLHAREPDAVPIPRADDDSIDLVHHPLLASLGRDARELARSLGGVELANEPPAAAAEPDSLLGWLQEDVRANRAPEESTRTTRRLATGDRSVQVHACHGPSRQVDVLREVLVGLLADDPTLEPRDIVVMCPDIETYAPLFEAGFGLAEATDDPHPAHLLRLKLADRGSSATNPLLALAARLVDLAEGRARAHEVLDLAGEAVVRRRFGFSDEDLDRISSWIDASGIRWGTGLAHRQRYGLDLFAHTWQDGLHRLFLGVGMGDEEFAEVRAVMPLDDVGSGDVDLVGRWGEFLSRLFAWLDAAVPGERLPVTEWMERLGSVVHGLSRTDADQTWMAAQFDRELTTVAQRAHTDEVDGAAHTLRLSDVRRLLADKLRGRPTRSNFRTGTLTVCTMVPMRSVPHRVVCLVGMDDGAFPRTQGVDGDDVLARQPLTGERDVRSEDRQLLLDAVMSASQTLVVTYHGADEQTGEQRPPCAPLAELIDALDLSASPETQPSTEVVIRHPLQPHDERNLVAGALVSGTPFSFDTDALAGAQAARHPAPEEPWVSGPLQPVVSDLTLADLRGFVTAPVKTFCTSRLQITLPREADELSDAIPIELDGLSAWAVGDRLVRAVLAGADPQTAIRSEQLRRSLPPGELGNRTLQQIAKRAQPLVAEGMQARAGHSARRIDVALDLPDGTRLTGVVPDIYGNRIVRVGYSSLGPKQRLTAWVDLLALSVAYPDQHWTAHTLGPRGRNTVVAVAGPLDHTARDHLLQLVDLYRRGLSEPLPIAPRTSLAWAEESMRQRMGASADPRGRAASRWETDPFADFPGENAAPEHVRVFGQEAPLSVLMGPPRDDERWSAEPTRLGQYADRLWGPLLSGAEQVRSL